MKYSINIRQPRAILRLADEIALSYNDINGIYNLLDEEELIKKRYVIEIEPEDEIDWDKLADLAAMVGSMHLKLHDLRLIKKCRESALDWFWAYPIQSYYELMGILDLHPSFFLLDAPLYFDLAQVRKKIGDIPIRLIANEAHNISIPRRNGISGTYVRPEDIPVYEKYIDTLEFKTLGPWEERLRKEKMLFEIYSSGSWAGNLNLLLTNFNVNVDNRAFPEEFAEARVQCRQSCMRESRCNLCENIIKTIGIVDRNFSFSQKS